METDVSLHTVVRCVDGIAGTSTAVILDPKTRAVTHVVVRERDGHKVERLVPIELVDRTSEDGIQLRCRSTALQTMDRFVERGSSISEQDRYGRRSRISGRFRGRGAPPRTGLAAHGESQGRARDPPRAEVDATDGPVGSVEAFLVMPKRSGYPVVVRRDTSTARSSRAASELTRSRPTHRLTPRSVRR